MTRASAKLVTIFGGSGFVGTRLVQQLAREGYRIRVAVRRPDLAGHVKPLGMVGQIQPVQANLRNMDSVMRAAEGSDIVINLVGVLYERGRQRFQSVQTAGAKNVAEAAAQIGAEALVHMSAIGADPESESAYARTKALGEEEVLKAFPKAVIIRPSIMFGQGDGFFSLFGMLARYFPVLPLIGANTKFQPVYVGDVATALARAAEGKVKGGKIYELGGPEIATMRELLERVLHETGRHNILMPIPMPMARFIGLCLQWLPSPLLTADQVVQLGTDNVVSDAAKRQKRTLAAFGLTPTTMEAILPTYMWRFRKHGQFEDIEA